MWEDDLEPYINKDKRYMTDAERIRHLEHGIREQRKEINNLRKEKAILKAKNKELEEYKENLIRADKKKTEHIEELEKKNITLKKEFEQYKQNYNIDRDRQTIFLMTGRRY